MKLKGIITSLIAVGLIAGAVYAAPLVYTSPDTYRNRGGISNDGGLSQRGGSLYNPVGTPIAPTVVQAGTAGATSTQYWCTAYDALGNATLQSAGFTTTTSNATLSAANYDDVFCPGVPGAMAFGVAAGTSNLQIGLCHTTSGNGCHVYNQGQAAATVTPQTVDQTTMISGAPKFACGGLVAVSAGVLEVTAPCIGNPNIYTSCQVTVAGGSTPVASNLGACAPTTTATVIGGSTATVGAVQIRLAGTASVSVNWEAGPQ